jgi:gluconolactonase
MSRVWQTVIKKERPFMTRIRPLSSVLALLAAIGLTSAAFAQAPAELPAGKPDATLDLATQEGVAQVQGQWRYSDTRIVEVEHKRPDGSPCKTYSYEPKAGGADFDDSSWEVLDPTTLGKPRSTGLLCFNWYRIRVTIPGKVGDLDTTGATLVFDTIVDDYGEVWVDGRLPRRLGQAGGSVVAGFNASNRLVVGRDIKPGQKITIAVFGINSPLSATPNNYIFLRHAKLDFYRKAP